MTALDLDNPFWHFSLKVYQAPGVSEECLRAQDELSIDVNVLLYAAWLGAVQGIALDTGAVASIEKALGQWSAAVVKPLRAVRRGLKERPDIAEPSIKTTRSRVAEIELFAEQVEQAMLHRMTNGFGQPGQGSSALAQKNIRSVLAAHGADASAFPLTKLLAASSACD